ncbi:hypothetical protein [Hirschia maritima]|uniref:hypothetical protein n=1 Tax=Hirschia maritima TaxID=1121961 RepID=UPI00037696B9|nr:hypothetical protein [Hirschia maritima]
MRALLSLLIIWGLTVSTTALAIPKKENLAELPVEETCGREYTRWQYFYATSKAQRIAAMGDYNEAIRAYPSASGPNASCWESFNFDVNLAKLNGAAGHVDVASRIWKKWSEIDYLSSEQRESLENLRKKIVQGDPKGFQTIGHLSKLEVVRKPAIYKFDKAVRAIGSGSYCYSIFDIDVKGKPHNLRSTCSNSKYEWTSNKVAAVARFKPKIQDGVIVEAKNEVLTFLIGVDHP